MKKVIKKKDWVKVATRVLAIAVILFGLPFYFGYGNPLPFANSEYSFFDNMWLCIFPLMFVGLGLGLKFEKVGGFMTTISVGLGLAATLIIEKEFIAFMLVPLAIGISYLVSGYRMKH